ncbi:MAG: hypothetical protein K9W46_06025 [Candidatus Heimdallarchaeum endolithica]|uniref:Uncharacterized protein n=1 Tax=Candidatus Heimdallarchaeum endolithica TaxID=2876572 RepID=A0A9Y1BTP2_9ARCH|nr:MAG: hypothetical protein K9W46_06025 [Candidatus Heimdallarchaeum endolithica]
MIPKQRIKVEQSYSNALGEEIIELIELTKEKKLLHSEVLDLLGNHLTIKLKIDELLYNNKILKIPVEIGNVKDYMLTIPRKEETGWDTMVCRCFTCERIHECNVNNPVNPILCKAFNEWLIYSEDINHEEQEKMKFKFEEFDYIEEEIQFIK